MNKELYIKYILEMLEKIQDDKLIKDIYMFVQSCFLSNDED